MAELTESTSLPGPASHRGFFSRLLRGLAAAIGFLCRALLIIWATLAIYCSNLPWANLRLALAVAFAAFAIWGFWLSRRRRMPAVVFVVFLGVVAWWLTIAPSHYRDWRPEVAVMPRAFINGDHVRITGVRNFDYRCRTTSRCATRSAKSASRI